MPTQEYVLTCLSYLYLFSLVLMAIYNSYDYIDNPAYDSDEMGAMWILVICSPAVIPTAAVTGIFWVLGYPLRKARKYVQARKEQS